METQTEFVPGERRCIGLDVHREFAQVAVWQGGLVWQAGRSATTPQGVRAFAEQLGPADEVALEATGNTCQADARAPRGRQRHGAVGYLPAVGRAGLGSAHLLGRRAPLGDPGDRERRDVDSAGSRPLEWCRSTRGRLCGSDHAVISSEVATGDGSVGVASRAMVASPR